ncbi:MAG: hypothetical protein M5U19_16435 [Microthrixaceae bacterium]|nr:hypothetical protein [Microthrixaceae bacterium]
MHDDEVAQTLDRDRVGERPLHAVLAVFASHNVEVEDQLVGVGLRDVSLRSTGGLVQPEAIQVDRSILSVAVHMNAKSSAYDKQGAGRPRASPVIERQDLLLDEVPGVAVDGDPEHHGVVPDIGLVSLGVDLVRASNRVGSGRGEEAELLGER